VQKKQHRNPYVRFTPTNEIIFRRLKELFINRVAHFNIALLQKASGLFLEETLE
jgi:hypothetical protein